MDMAALAALAGNALVTAAVTDAWDDARHKIACWFGRGKPDPGIGRRLDATRQRLAAVPVADRPRVQASEAAAWQVRFADLVADYPDSAEELRALVGEIDGNVAAATDHSAAAGRDMTARADHGGFAANVVHGDIALGPTSPDAARV
jgi:hypothetical protein